LIKRKWLLIVIALIVLISGGLGIYSCNTTPNPDREVASALGLSLREFRILDEEVHEYLYEKYPFLRDTQFGISYERVDAKVEGTPPESLIIDAYSTFRDPPVVVRAAFYDGNAEIISEIIIDEEQF
jgi:hypothetical protein